MAPKKRKAPQGDSELESDHEPIGRTNRGYAEVAGFFDTEIPASLYGVWHGDVAQLMRESSIYGPQRAGSDRWMTFHWHAASLPTMAPKGMINYCSNKAIVHAVNML